jgi:SAM-dependent methyltransferase
MEGSVATKIRHPSKYSDVLLPHFSELLSNCKLILDPFAGTGKLRKVFPNAILLEIEPEWAILSSDIIGDVLHMPFKKNIFDAICTSPTYGNRMADSFIDHKPEKQYVRNTYMHCLGRKLSSNNSGCMQWGKQYRDFHIKAWKECKRVLKENGLFVLNISDHIRKGKVIPVTKWHMDTIQSIGFSVIECRRIKTKRLKMGSNRGKRVTFESVILFKGAI